VLGFAWMLGALSALESVAEFDVRDSDVVVGTSAGSVAAAVLGCGMSIDVLARHHQGIPLPEDPLIDYDYTATGEAKPPRPGWRPASPRMTAEALRHPRRVSPIVALSGLLPAGRGSLAPVHELVDTVAALAGYDTAWPQAPRPWIVAADYRTGRRVVFGRDDIAPGSDGRPRLVRSARLADAVQASCSIPAWYPPTLIDGVPYIDGGTISNASVDVLRGVAVDEVYIFAPMASVVPDRPKPLLARIERRVRASVTRRIVNEAMELRAQGKSVYIVTPGPADLDTMGLNLMNPARRGEVFDGAKVTAAEQLSRQLELTSGWGSRQLRRVAPGSSA
jgi:NTE family protein